MKPQSMEMAPGCGSDVPPLSRRALGLLAATAVLAGCASNEHDPVQEEPVIPHVSTEALDAAGGVDLLRAGHAWQYVDGVQLTPAGIIVTPTGRTIINKREGGRVEPNPPLVVFGPRLQVGGDFELRVSIQDMETPAPTYVQLHSRPPIRLDDFRYEQPRVECAITSGSLEVRLWRQPGNREPDVVQRMALGTVAGEHAIKMLRVGDELAFVVDGQMVGRLPGGSIFGTGQVWLGIHKQEGAALVRELRANPLHGHALAVVDTASLRITKQTPEGLQSLIRGKPDFRFGTAAALSPLVSDERYAQLVLGSHGSITPENELKWQNVQPQEGVFSLAEANALVQLAVRHHLAVHGHTLVYSKATPAWVRNLPSATQADRRRVEGVLVKHIQTVVSPFRGLIQSWDVVNEVISGFNGAATLEDNIFYRALGKQYIAIAFRAAHEADPDAMLYINDYGLETNPQGRGQYMSGLVRSLLDQGVPIHGVGVQGHVYELPRDRIHPHLLREQMEAYGQMGLSVRVSELDVTGANGAGAQAQQYADALRVCLNAPNCTGLTIWGASDAYGSTARLDANGRLQPGDALLYGVDYRPKLALRAMRAVLR